MNNIVKSAFKPFVDEFEKIGSQTVSQAAQAVKKIASDVVNETVNSSQSAVGSKDAGTNENLQSGQQAADAKALTAKQADDQAKAQQQIAQIRQNLKALMTPPKPPPEKPIYYKMWEDLEKKKQEKMELEVKKHEENVAVRAAGKSTGEMKKGIGG